MNDLDSGVQVPGGCLAGKAMSVCIALEGTQKRQRNEVRGISRLVEMYAIWKRG